MRIFPQTRTEAVRRIPAITGACPGVWIMISIMAPIPMIGAFTMIRMMPLINSGKGAAWNFAPVVSFTMTPLWKSTLTASPGLMPSTASGHSRMGKPMLMALR